MPPKRKQRAKRPVPVVRRKRRRLAPTLLRTTDQIQRNLQKAMSNMEIGPVKNPFLMCRKYPFEAKPSNGIPDGDGVKKIVIDHRAYSTVVVGTSGTFVLKMIPALPHCLLFKAGTSVAAFTVDGATPDVNSIFTTQGYWWPCKLFPEYTNYVAAPTAGLAEVSNPYSCSGFRFVTLAMKITYVGAPTLATGTITVYSDTMAVEDARRLNTNPVVIAGAAATIANGNAYIRNMDFPTPVASLSSDTLVERIDKCVMVRPKHYGPYSWIDTPYTKTCSVDSTVSGASWISNISTPINNLDYSQLLGVDPNWSPVTAFVEGMTPGTSLRVEYIVCVEYRPGIQSESFRLAKASEDKPAQFKQTESQVAATPTASAKPTEVNPN